ncbi:hypothetical protein PHLGIDRAFT_121561 [Phlebiopsis gigantea 11061_1 CR5-6]|uniref:Uncharacterized protein n=1 Tax=Phlebiopsis gigantea (strain 11061_1 CR5-6) TaxID=745531 RepID=A0A0C3PDN8_PHLG1|nr:hypothetical protein PHLGIDRAFT_121561 [Phlebiopsis gigantea 11061_1 CR5-6]
MDPPWAGDPSFGGALPVAHLAGILDDVDMAIVVRERWYDMLVDELTQLRIQRNRTVPLISHLVDDILVQIFTLLVNDSWDTRKEQLKITHICRHWRSLALSVPNLWRIIRTGLHRECTATFIERSKDQPLSIRMCEPDEDLEAGFFRLLEKAPDRLQHLHLFVRRSLMLAVHEDTYGDVLDHEAGSASILTTVDLTYTSADPDDRTELPSYFWFLSRDTSLPKLEILRLAKFPHFTTEELLRPTLTELDIDSSDCVSVEEWRLLLKTLPVLESLSLGATEERSRLDVSAPEMVRMERLRSVCLHRGYDGLGSSLGCAQLLDLLLIPSHVIISLSAESCRDSDHAQFVFDVLGSKKDGSRCIGEPQPLTGLRLEVGGNIYLWSHTKPDYNQSHTRQSYADSISDHAIHIRSHYDDDTVQQTITNSKLPLTNIEVICIEGITLLPGYLSCFTHLRELHCHHHGHRALLKTLASLAPGDLPHLRSLTLERPKWHSHPSGCKLRPFGGRPLSVAIDKLLASRHQFLLCMSEARSMDPPSDEPSPGDELSLIHLAENDLDTAIADRERWYRRLGDELIRLRTHRNSIASPISRIPDDILAEIFTLSVVNLWDSHKYRIWVAHICSHWRRVALSLPGIWNVIRVNQHLDCTATFIERSNNLPLSIHDDMGSTGGDLRPGFFRLLTDVSDRLQHLQLSVGRSLMIALHEFPYRLDEDDEPDEAPILETVDLTYTTVDLTYTTQTDEDEAEPPAYFWFLSSDTSLPNLKALRLSGFPSFITYTLLRPTLTELEVDPNECLAVVQWLQVIRVLPNLERLTLGEINPEDGPLAAVPAPHMVRMERLRELLLHRGAEGDGSALGCAQLLNRLLIPSDCMIGVPWPHENVRQGQFLLDVLGSKKDGTACIGDPQPLTALGLRQSEVLLWSRTRPVCIPSYITQYRAHYSGNRERNHVIHIKPCSIQEIIQVIIAGSNLPLRNIELLCLEDIIPPLQFLSCFTHLRELHCHHSSPQSLLQMIASLASDNLPHLRSLMLDHPKWHVHPAACEVQPLGGEPLGAALDDFLASRRAHGLPLEELNLHHIQSFDHVQDAPWLQHVSREVPRLTWTHCPGRDPHICFQGSSCPMCDGSQE